MADFGADGISLRGLAGKRLKEQQKKEYEEHLKNLEDPLGLSKTLKDLEEKAKGGLIGEEDVLKKLKQNDPDRELRRMGKLPSLKKMKEGGRVGLYANINRRKKLGISRPKSKSTISKESYSNMKKGFPSRGQGKVSKVKITKSY
jgi:hypothetical protein